MTLPPKASLQTPHWNVSGVCGVLVGRVLGPLFCMWTDAYDVVRSRVLVPVMGHVCSLSSSAGYSL